MITFIFEGKKFTTELIREKTNANTITLRLIDESGARNIYTWGKAYKHPYVAKTNTFKVKLNCIALALRLLVKQHKIKVA